MLTDEAKTAFSKKVKTEKTTLEKCGYTKPMREHIKDAVKKEFPDMKDDTVNIMIENGYRIKDIKNAIDKKDTSLNRVCAVEDNADFFGICADTGHSNKATRFGNPSSADVIRMCGKDLIALHLNDNDTVMDQHKIPKTGTIDWNDVFNALDEIGYKGNYNMELNLKTISAGLMVETGEFAVKVMRNMLNEHYGEN